MYFSNSLINFFGWRFFVWLFQFQFQFFTLNTENSDKTKSRKVDCDSDMTNLSSQEIFVSSESLLNEPPSSDLLTTGGGTKDRRFSLRVTIGFFWFFNSGTSRPYESCKIFKGRPRRNAFSKMVHRQYKSFQFDRFCQFEMKNPTRLSNKTSNA